MKHRQEEASGSRGKRKFKLRKFLKKPKENARARRNRRTKSGGLVEKINLESEPNQDPGPSNRGQSGAGQAVSTRNSLELDRQCFVAVKRLTLAEIEEMKQNLAKMCIMQLPEEVLRHILGFVRFTDVKSVRLVNQLCRQVATTQLRRLSRPITVDQSVIEYITNMGAGLFPVYRLKVRLDEGGCRNSKKTEICSSYFSTICDWVKELTLEMDINDNYRNQKKIDTFPRDCVYKELTQLNLQLIQRTILTREFWKQFTDFVRNILEKSSNLREVNVRYESYWNTTRTSDKLLPFCPVIEDLFPNSNAVGSSKLSYINFHEAPLEQIDLAKWSTLNLKLKKLRISLSSSSNLNDLLAKFLETQTGTLKELTLNLDRCRCVSEPSPVSFIIPRMENLEQLQFASFFVCCGLATFPSIDYNKLFPSLKKLGLEYGVDWREFLGNNFLKPTNTVEELIFPRTLVFPLPLTPAPVVSAARIFPALKKLEIPARSCLVLAVYRNMPNLEVLSLIKTSGSFEDVITGLELAVYGSFKGVLTDTWIKTLKTAEGRSMACLQKLKTLKLSNNSVNPNCFSQLSFHVLKQVSSLKYLDLFNGCAAAAERDSADVREKQFLKAMRTRFVVL